MDKHCSRDHSKCTTTTDSKKENSPTLVEQFINPGYLTCLLPIDVIELGQLRSAQRNSLHHDAEAFHSGIAKRS